MNAQLNAKDAGIIGKAFVAGIIKFYEEHPEAHEEARKWAKECRKKEKQKQEKMNRKRLVK